MFCGVSENESVTLMDLFTVVLVAVGLAMDCFAVSITRGILRKRLHLGEALTIAFFFGFFQTFMATLGWVLASYFAGQISGIDHWIAFVLLLAVGLKMLYESFKDEGESKRPEKLDIPTLLTLSLATSIDALAVGVSFAFLDTSIVVPVLVIGAVSFLFAVAGALVGSRAGKYVGSKAELVGGLILIGIGLKILIEHLL